MICIIPLNFRLVMRQLCFVIKTYNIYTEYPAGYNCCKCRYTVHTQHCKYVLRKWILYTYAYKTVKTKKTK